MGLKPFETLAGDENFIFDRGSELTHQIGLNFNLFCPEKPGPLGQDSLLMNYFLLRAGLRSKPANTIPVA